MVHRDQMAPGKQVLGSDGGMVGTVQGLHGDHIHVQPTAPAPDAPEHTVPLSWVTRVDDHVHLNRPAAQVRETWGAGHGVPAGAAAYDHRNRDRKSWVPWLIGIILLLAILYIAMRAFNYGTDDSRTTEQPLPSTEDTTKNNS